MKTLSLQAPSFDGFDGGAGMCHIAVRCRQARDPSLRYRLTIPESDAAPWRSEKNVRRSRRVSTTASSACRVDETGSI
jgi:hypothetical protein